MIQICLNYNPFNLNMVLFVVMVVLIDEEKKLYPTT